MSEPAGKGAVEGVPREAARYGIAGLVNTAIGYGTFLALYEGGGLSPAWANAGSYAVGLLAALLLNRYFVFKGSRLTTTAVWRFALGFMLAYLLNLVTLALALSLKVAPWLAQVFAMGVYTVSFYWVNRLWVWGPRGAHR